MKQMMFAPETMENTQRDLNRFELTHGLKMAPHGRYCAATDSSDAFSFIFDRLSRGLDLQEDLLKFVLLITYLVDRASQHREVTHCTTL